MNIEDLLREAGREARNEQVSPALEKNLVRVYQAQRRRRWISIAAMAASVVIVVGGLWQLSRLTPVQPETNVHTAIEKVEILPEGEGLASDLLPMQPESSGIPRRSNAGRGTSISGSSQRDIRDTAVHSEIRTRFYALDASVLAEEMDGYLIRVQVPRAAMASFGIPVQYGVEETRVNADLLIGENGMARAIRFVQPIQ